jgi:ketosteroid isomerase-like protein
MKIRWSSSSVCAFALFAAVALLIAGCGNSDADASSGSAASTDSGSPSATRLATPTSARTDPTAAMQEFLDAVKSGDAAGFCRLTTLDVQRSNFKAANLPPGDDCVASAAAMFKTKAPSGAEPFWEAIAQATIGKADVHCDSTEHCESAVVEVRDLPLAGGGTTMAPVTMTYRQGQWRIGPLS